MKCQMIWKTTQYPKSVVSMHAFSIHHPGILEMTVYLMKAMIFYAFCYEICYWIL